MPLLLLLCPCHQIFRLGVVLQQTIVEQGVKHGTCVVSGQRLGAPGKMVFPEKLPGQQRPFVLVRLLRLLGLRGISVRMLLLLRIPRLGLVRCY